jgi:hypothetical protein
VLGVSCLRAGIIPGFKLPVDVGVDLLMYILSSGRWAFPRDSDDPQVLCLR